MRGWVGVRRGCGGRYGRMQLAEPRACAASQVGGVMCVIGHDDSAITATISDGAISGCSAVAGGDVGVRARHVAQRGPSLGGGGERRGMMSPRKEVG